MAFASSTIEMGERQELMTFKTALGGRNGKHMGEVMGMIKKQIQFVLFGSFNLEYGKVEVVIEGRSLSAKLF